MRPSSVGALRNRYPRKRARINDEKPSVLGAAADSMMRHLLYALLQRVAGRYGSGGRVVIEVIDVLENIPKTEYTASGKVPCSMCMTR